MNKNNMALMTISKLILYFCLLFSSTSLFANAISFNFEMDQAKNNSLDKQLIQTLENRFIFKKLDAFAEQNLNLEKHITFKFRHQNSTYFLNNPLNKNPTKNDKEQILIIPFSLLYQLYHDISLKFPQQEDVRDRIYASAVEKHLWFEFGRLLINQYGLAVSGREDYLLDNFSTLMLINLKGVDSEYILDATEAYLLADHSQPLLMSDAKFSDELEFDEHRYRIVVCLILGKDLDIKNDQVLNNTAPFVDLLSDLSWGKKRLAECRELYRQKLLAWYQALLPHLKETNQLKKWLAADAIS